MKKTKNEKSKKTETDIDSMYRDLISLNDRLDSDFPFKVWEYRRGNYYDRDFQKITDGFEFEKMIGCLPKEQLSKLDQLVKQYDAAVKYVLKEGISLTVTSSSKSASGYTIDVELKDKFVLEHFIPSKKNLIAVIEGTSKGHDVKSDMQGYDNNVIFEAERDMDEDRVEPYECQLRETKSGFQFKCDNKEYTEKMIGLIQRSLSNWVLLKYTQKETCMGDWTYPLLPGRFQIQQLLDYASTQYVDGLCKELENDSKQFLDKGIVGMSYHFKPK